MFGRYLRMTGHHVLHPFGFDTFGLPAEQYAIDTGNWCPGLGTVLADEEVTGEGRSAVGNYPVHRRPLRQWMLRITAFAERLLAGLDEVDRPEHVKKLQRNWTGPSGGPYHLKDWLFSRQRYWGEPFPIVYDEAEPSRPIALPEDLLPVTLPEMTDFRPVPQADPALAAADTVALPVQVDGKVRFTVEVPAQAGQAEIAELLAAHPGYPRAEVARLVIVPGKIASIVLR